MESEWFNVVTWGTLAEICNQYLLRNQQVYIEGRLQSRRWEDSQGCKHTSVEIVATEMMILGDRKENEIKSASDNYEFSEDYHL
jgi:single-strand DNA-binding protein